MQTVTPRLGAISVHPVKSTAMREARRACVRVVASGAATGGREGIEPWMGVHLLIDRPGWISVGDVVEAP